MHATDLKPGAAADLASVLAVEALDLCGFLTGAELGEELERRAALTLGQMRRDLSALAERIAAAGPEVRG